MDFSSCIDLQYQVFLHNIEKDVKVVRVYVEDSEVDNQVAPFVLDLGSSIARDTKFFRTIEIYWHTKDFVAHTMLAKELEFKASRQRMEAIEVENNLLLSLVSWLVKKNGGLVHIISR
jgi:hypothetical protein